MYAYTICEVYHTVNFSYKYSLIISMISELDEHELIKVMAKLKIIIQYYITKRVNVHANYSDVYIEYWVQQFI